MTKTKKNSQHRCDTTADRPALAFLSRSPVVLTILVAAVAGCTDLPPENTVASPPQTAAAGNTNNTTPVSVDRPEVAQWKQGITKEALPREGCFVVTHPDSSWKEVPCGAPVSEAHLPYAQAYSPEVAAATISRAEGSFPVTNNVVSVNDTITGTGQYSLQLNTNFFDTPLCAGAFVPSGCKGWQQFVYSPGGDLHIEYWLTNYNPDQNHPCPASFATFDQHCRSVSPNGQPPSVPVSALGSVSLVAKSGATETVYFTVGDSIYAVSNASVLGLAGKWSLAEFNIYGLTHGSTAMLNDGASMVVQTLVNSANAPTCHVGRTTAESNNLTTVDGSCCAFGGAYPGIQFTQSNVPGATAQACPLAISRVQKPTAFQANTGFLWIDENGAGRNTWYGMKRGTIPSLVITRSMQPAVAFQANTGNLWVYKDGIGTDKGYPMDAGSSPSITLDPGFADIAVAFQGSDGDLRIYRNRWGRDYLTNTYHPMMPGTSPSIGMDHTILGEPIVALQGDDGFLYLYRDGQLTNTWLGMMAKTSPSLGVLSNGQVVIAFQANSGFLYLYQNGVATNTGLGMMARTSPSVAVLTDDKPAVAFQANSGYLYLYRNGVGTNTWFGMMRSASPHIESMSPGYQISFEANTSHLWLNINGVGRDQYFGMDTP